jgi:hypothetical protein
MSDIKVELANASTQPLAPWTYWVVDGLLLAGPYPGAPDPEESRDKLGTLLGSGIVTFVNLMEEDKTNASGDEFSPYDHLARDMAPSDNVRCERFPIRDLSIPTKDSMRSILDDIDRSLRQQQAVYVHCWGGVGRTGTVIGCWLLRHGLTDKENVFKTIQELRQQDKHRGDRASPETAAQESFVREWTE